MTPFGRVAKRKAEELNVILNDDLSELTTDPQLQRVARALAEKGYFPARGMKRPGFRELLAPLDELVDLLLLRFDWDTVHLLPIRHETRPTEEGLEMLYEAAHMAARKCYFQHCTRPPVETIFGGVSWGLSGVCLLLTIVTSDSHAVRPDWLKSDVSPAHLVNPRTGGRVMIIESGTMGRDFEVATIALVPGEGVVAGQVPPAFRRSHPERIVSEAMNKSR